MTVLSRPRHPTVAAALELARTWCAGHLIDGAPALGHAVKVALTLDRHMPCPPPDLVAAVLLHDAPEYAPNDVDLDGLLTARLGASVAWVVRALEQEHNALAEQPTPTVATTDPWTLHASAADKIVSRTSILRRATRSGDPAAYWASRAPFIARLPYLRAFHTTTAPHLPASMATELGQLVGRAEHATRTGSTAAPVDATTQINAVPIHH